MLQNSKHLLAISWHDCPKHLESRVQKCTIYGYYQPEISYEVIMHKSKWNALFAASLNWRGGGGGGAPSLELGGKKEQ